MSPPPPLLLPLLLLLLLPPSPGVATAAAVANATADCQLGIIEAVCRIICQYDGSPLADQCQDCYPSVCQQAVSPARPVARLQTSTETCIGDDGVTRPIYNTWYDQELYPCKVYTCQAYGYIQVVDLGASCEPPPTALGNCSRHRNVGQCCFNYTCTIPNNQNLSSCVDDFGRVRAHGDTWTDDPTYPCVTYACNNGNVAVVQDMRPLCPLQPELHCVPYRLAGQCCHSYNCSVISGLQSCRSDDGALRPHADVWYDDPDYPCLKYVCNNGSIIVVVDKRAACPPVPTEPGCQAARPLGACCYSYTCGCLYNGVLYANGQEFPDNALHPCRLLRCASGAVVTVTEQSCPRLLCTNQAWPNGECCRTCAPCLFNGVEYPIGATWFDDPTRPCVQYRCDDGRAVTVLNTTCDPAPHAGCTVWYMEGVCCPKWDCTDAPCVHQGVSHEHGTTWPENPLKPCRHLVCNNSAVSVASEAPPCAGPPAGDCVIRDVPYQCCPVYDCVKITCQYNGQSYAEGETWLDDPNYPCKRFTCTKTGPVKVLDLTSGCAPLVPPDCPSERSLGECCKNCVTTQDPNCFDEQGTPHGDGEKFFLDPETKCVFVECLYNRTEVLYDRRDFCGPDPRPGNPGCTVTTIKDCCPVYHCPPCVFNGVSHPIGSTWWDDDEKQCIRYNCAADGTINSRFTKLPCADVRAGCVASYRNSECCHYKYTCMFDPQHNLIPMP